MLIDAALRGGGAGASISAPGPFDPTANTYYNITPLDRFTDEEAESFLREYNDWMLQILNIHEAIPGHYTQLMHANKSKSLVKALFGNGSMIEGWAVFSEKVMLAQNLTRDEQRYDNFNRTTLPLMDTWKATAARVVGLQKHWRIAITHRGAARRQLLPASDFPLVFPAGLSARPARQIPADVTRQGPQRHGGFPLCGRRPLIPHAQQALRPRVASRAFPQGARRRR